MNSPKLAGSLNKYGFAKADNKSIQFMSTHGVVDAMPYDCVSLTFGMSKVVLPHTPVMRKICKSLTTMCDHDIGVVIEDE